MVLRRIVRRRILVTAIDLIVARLHVAIILFLVVDHLLLLHYWHWLHVLLLFGDLQDVLNVSKLAGELVPLLLAG